METSELLLEIGTEEIPASMLQSSAHQLAETLVADLQAQRLASEIQAVWFTPRRFIIGLRNIPVRQEDLVETVTGPPKNVAFDAEGKPTKAAHAFAQKHGVALSHLKITQSPKGEYLTALRRVKGEKTRTILQQIVPAAIGKIQFPKSMYWTVDKFRFARPLRWILALYQGRVIKFRLADVVSSKFTSGHRFIGRPRLAVSDLASLSESLRRNGVLADPAERQTRIVDGLAREAEKASGRLVEDPKLMSTVVNLNEYPSVIRGSFDPRFLELPQEILITVMREHQKYFSVMDGSGALLPYFLAVINLDTDASEEIRRGHERVLRARLSDAAFFWQTDRRKKLGDRLEALGQVLFQEKLGTYYDKTRRLLDLVPQVAGLVGESDQMADLEEAARLSKCDLVTEMVKEFTDLQGIVGGLYARAEGYPQTVWRAVYEHYLPKSTTDPSPSTRAGAILALVDRLDTVCGCFSVGLIPTGSNDPFAVRRQGNGLLKILLDHRLSVSLTQLIDWSLRTHQVSSEQTAGELRKFFEGRLRFLFDEMGHSYDSINAILSVDSDNPLDALERMRALEGIRQEDDFLALTSNFKRVMNILKQAGAVGGEPNVALMTDPAERSLWDSYLEVKPEVENARRRHDYGQALRSMASIRRSVDQFFDEVLVMAEDERLKKNRLSFLNQLAQLFLTVADISQIAGERSRSN